MSLRRLLRAVGNYIIRHVRTADWCSWLMTVHIYGTEAWGMGMGGVECVVWNVCRRWRCKSLAVNSYNLPGWCWCFVLSYMRNASFQFLMTGKVHTMEFWNSMPCTSLIYFDSSVLEAHNLRLIRVQEILSKLTRTSMYIQTQIFQS